MIVVSYTISLVCNKCNHSTTYSVYPCSNNDLESIRKRVYDKNDRFCPHCGVTMDIKAITLNPEKSSRVSLGWRCDKCQSAWWTAEYYKDITKFKNEFEKIKANQKCIVVGCEGNITLTNTQHNGSRVEL